MKIWKAGEYKYEAHYRVLARRVMAIAIVNKTVGDWAAYMLMLFREKTMIKNSKSYLRKRIQISYTTM